MRIFICCILLITNLAITSFGQNVGIGTTEPMNKMHIVGNLLVNTLTSATSTPPTVAQTKTLPGLGTISFLNSDSTGRLYDPGGPAGNYGIDQDSKADIPSSINIAIEVTAETMNLNTGDSLIIKESSTGITLLAVGNGYNSTGKWIFNSSSLYIRFKSNSDFNTGAGFSLLFKKLYDISYSLPNVSGATGKTLLFDAKNGSFRSGGISNEARGFYSTAMGYNSVASGLSSTAMGWNAVASEFSSTAMGNYTTASGNFSTAMGEYTIASGNNSTAMGGSGTTASGENSTALGRGTHASGDYSTTFGFNTTASGDYSTAMGSYVSTNNFEGSFVVGDNSTTTVMNSANANNFRARFAGGYKLFTSSNLSTGCTLFAGDNAWTTSSDVRTKENFAEVNGEDFLKKIAGFHLTSWNYKTQDPTTFRHYGPMAQDFFAAFGKDRYGTIGNETGINSTDFAGVSFIAIQALEKRTQKIEQLEKENEALKKMLLQLKKEVDALKGIKIEN
jgi:Head domain of trimeric autotransporter adhesin/Chaperone of endosialidase